MTIYLEDVFKTSGLPTYTFVRPPEYNKILVSLRTKGRCLVVEGPSGIGKTTCVLKVLEELAINKKVTKLTARKPEDVDVIKILHQFDTLGAVIIDDFHLLPSEIKATIADYMKVLADEEKSDKLILIGINKAGDSLVKLAEDLNNRIDTVSFEQNPIEKIEELIELGEKALSIEINVKKEISELAGGSFHIAQLLCKETCIDSNILSSKDELLLTASSIEVIREKILSELGRNFYPKAKRFATGNRLRREGRAPYLHLLHWLSRSEEWSLQMDDIYAKYPEHKLSVNQIVEKGFLEGMIRENPELQDVIHYDTESKILSIEDPKFMFYIRNILWSKFAERVGYISIIFEGKYDFALSFAGETRDLAQALNDYFLENEVSVFYDKNEQHRILAENVEDYLAPIYKSEANFIIVLLSEHYPKKIWTKFESDQFKERFGSSKVIPIWYKNTPPGIFDVTYGIGGISFDPDQNLEEQANKIAATIIAKLAEERQKQKGGSE